MAEEAIGEGAAQQGQEAQRQIEEQGQALRDNFNPGGVLVTHPMTLLEKMNEVRRRIGYIQKDTTIKTGNRSYTAVTHDKVTSAIRKHLVDLGVLVIPSVIDRKVSTVPTASGSTMVMYEGTFEVIFANVNSRGEIRLVVDAHAWDNGDKAPGKALSYATKYAMLKVFSLETGENDEARVEYVGPRITTEQGDQLWAFAEAHMEVWDHPNKAMAAIAKKAGVKTVDDLAADGFGRAMEYLKRVVREKKAREGEVDKETGEIE